MSRLLLGQSSSGLPDVFDTNEDWYLIKNERVRILSESDRILECPGQGTIDRGI